MSWIRFDSETPNKVQVLELARELKLPRPHILGALCLVWTWFSEQTVLGLSRTVLDTIDDVADTPGFGAALVRVGWLELLPDGAGIVMPAFDRHTGSAHDARRKAKERAEKPRLRVSRTVLDKSRTVPDLSRNVPSQSQSQRQREEAPSLRSGARAREEGGLVSFEPARRKEASGPLAEAIRGFDELCREFLGEPWKPWGGKNARAMAGCLKAAGGNVPLVLERARRMFEDPPDEWVAQNASPWLLESRWTNLAARAHVSPAAKQAARNKANLERLFATTRHAEPETPRALPAPPERASLLDPGRKPA